MTQLICIPWITHN